MKPLPALLLSEELKRKNAKAQVEDAIETIKHYGSAAGLSDRSLFEFSTITGFMLKELKRELKNKSRLDRSPEEWPL